MSYNDKTYTGDESANTLGTKCTDCSNDDCATAPPDAQDYAGKDAGDVTVKEKKTKTKAKKKSEAEAEDEEAAPAAEGEAAAVADDDGTKQDAAGQGEFSRLRETW